MIVLGTPCRYVGDAELAGVAGQHLVLAVRVASGWRLVQEDRRTGRVVAYGSGPTLEVAEASAQVDFRRRAGVAA